jgi:hypothetical protein
MGRADQTERKMFREKVFERDGYTCRYCGGRDGPFHADHVYPYKKGGETSIANMVTACERCNTRKGSKVGIYPMPIGYFDKYEGERKELVKNAVSGMKQEGSLILASLIPSGLVFALMWTFPNDFGWFIVKLTVTGWLGASAYCAVYWVWDTLRGEK